MNFAIPFFKQFKYQDDDIQWNINYKPKVKQLNNFIESYGTHRINLIITDFELNRDCEIVQALIEKFPETQIVMCLPEYNAQLEQELNNKQLPHYYNEFVNNWDRFEGFLNLNVTDIFVAENLLFNLKVISKKAKEKGKALRSFCNICQSAWQDTPSLKTFFVRPEDISLYENSIDTFEFFMGNSSNLSINTLYKIYTKDKKWFGYINEIILNYNGTEHNNQIIPLFGFKRLNCGKRCFQDVQPTCHICDKIMQLNKTLYNKDILLKTKEKERV